MNIERFHNELALRLGYERIVKDRRISISVEECDDPWVTLTILGSDKDIRFKASDAAEEVFFEDTLIMQDEIKVIIDAVHQAYIKATTNPF